MGARSRTLHPCRVRPLLIVSGGGWAGSMHRNGPSSGSSLSRSCLCCWITRASSIPPAGCAKRTLLKTLNERTNARTLQIQFVQCTSSTQRRRYFALSAGAVGGAGGGASPRSAADRLMTCPWAAGAGVVDDSMRRSLFSKNAIFCCVVMVLHVDAQIIELGRAGNG